MKVPTPEQATLEIVGSIKRRRANFFVTKTPAGKPSNQPFMMMSGSFQAAQTPEGFIVTMGVSREKLTEIRDACNELLGES